MSRPKEAPRPPPTTAAGSAGTPGNTNPAGSGGNLTVRKIDFEGRPVTGVNIDGRWMWGCAEVGEAIGYDPGRILVDKIRGDWSEDFREGVDFELLRGPALKAFRELSSDSLESSKFAGRLLVLTASGIDRALILSRTDKGRRLRDLLVDHVLPQLRETGTATLPGAPPAAPALAREDLATLIAELVARELDHRLPPLAARGPTGPESVLGRDDRARILGPVLRLARKVAGPKAGKEDVSRERGRIERRIRQTLKWDARWCLFPVVRSAELVLAVSAEERLAAQAADRADRDRQLSLRAVDASKRPRKPSR